MRNVVTDTPYKNFNLSVTGAFSASVDGSHRDETERIHHCRHVRFTRGRHEMSMGFEYRKQTLDKNFRWLLDRHDVRWKHYRIRRGGLLHREAVAFGRAAYGEVGKQDFPVTSPFQKQH